MKIVATMYLPPHFKLFEFYVQPKRIEFTQIILSLQSLTERINFLKVMYFAFFSLNFDFITQVFHSVVKLFIFYLEIIIPVLFFAGC